jgi:hypothetical protein
VGGMVRSNHRYEDGAVAVRLHASVAEGQRVAVYGELLGPGYVERCSRYFVAPYGLRYYVRLASA